MKRRRGALPGDGARRQPRGPGATSPSTRSARRSRTASTREVGSVEVGKLADLVLWEPAFFGVRPHAVHQGRHDRVGRDGRRQRVDPDPAAGAAAADVRRGAGRRRGHVGALRRAAAHRGRAGRPARGATAGWSPVRERPAGRQGRHAAQRRAAPHRGRPATPSPCASTARSGEEQPAAELPMAQRYFLF